MNIYSYSPFGYEGAIVSVEAVAKDGIFALDIVGLADGQVKESRERVKAAIKNSGFALFPERRVLLSLSPADLKKEGAGFDLAMAMAVLCAQDSNSAARVTDSWLCYAELELSGNLRPVRGTYAALESGLSKGIKKAIVPSCIPNAEIPQGMTAYRVDTLKDAWHVMTLFVPPFKCDLPEPRKTDEIEFCEASQDETIDNVKNPALVRAMMIAAAGRHHLLAVGSPGCGKTVALLRFPQLLPALTAGELQSVKRIHSIAGLMSGGEMKFPPFRMPHQSASLEGMVGGGVQCRPGEISLAHNGVLFLDEAAEFRSSVLQMLRVPLESQKIALSRAGRSAVYPANFQLLMAANPCPCGNYGGDERACLCSSTSVENYWRKFSAPLIDRIPIRVHVKPGSDCGEQPTLASMREKIAAATIAQRKRGVYNQRLSIEQTASFCVLTDGAKEDFDAMGARNVSEREKSNALKVARTIADLNGSEKIEKEHLAEAAALATWRLSLMT